MLFQHGGQFAEEGLHDPVEEGDVMAAGGGQGEGSHCLLHALYLLDDACLRLPYPALFGSICHLSESSDGSCMGSQSKMDGWLMQAKASIDQRRKDREREARVASTSNDRHRDMNGHASKRYRHENGHDPSDGHSHRQ